MNGFGKPVRKSDPKNRWYSKNESEIAACEQKITSEQANFCSNTVFSLYFKIRAEKFHAVKALAFLLHFLFRCDQNYYSNLTSKIIKIANRKKTAPQYNSNSLDRKKHSRTSPDVQFKEFSLNKQKIRPGMNYERIRETSKKIRSEKSMIQ